MHLQIRAIPAKSPADLKAFLEVLALGDINIVAAGGSNLEQGGEFAFVVNHGQEDEAIRLLKEAGYQPRALDASVETEDGAVFTTCWLTEQPGQLLACVTSVTDANAAAGRVIKDISVGKPGDDGLIPVQTYSEAFRGRLSKPR